MVHTEEVGLAEVIVRVLVESRQVKNGVVSFKAFLPSPGTREISVHRRSYMSDEVALEHALRVARARMKKFYGWAKMVVRDAVREGREVVAAPEDDNQLHAHVLLPEEAMADRDVRRAHAHALALPSVWVEPPRRGDSG